MVELIQYVYLGGLIVALHFTAAKSLKQVLNAFGVDSMCLVSSNAIVAMAVLPLSQMQNLKEVTWVAVLGVLMIIAPLVIYLYQTHEDKGESSSTRVLPANNADFYGFTNALTTIMFAFQGQTIYPELISHMHTRCDFPKAAKISVAFMCLVYATVMAVGYSFMGDLGDYLIDYVDPKASTTTAANTMLILHVMAGYVLNCNVMNHVIYKWIYLRRPQKREEKRLLQQKLRQQKEGGEKQLMWQQQQQEEQQQQQEKQQQQQ
jgi:amino acid permease